MSKVSVQKINMNQTDDLYAFVEKKERLFAFFCIKTCIFGLFVVSLQAESTNNLYIQLVYGCYKYNIIKFTDRVHIPMVIIGLR